MRSIILFVLTLCSAPFYSQLVQWRGINRDGHFDGTALMKEWPEKGPRMVLKVDGIGTGFSSAVKMGKMVYVAGRKDTLDYLSAINLADGRIIWQVPYGRAWIRTFSDTRPTPTVEGDNIYLMSGTGQLACMNRNDGKIKWKSDVDRQNHAIWHSWGVAESPLVVDDLVISTPGGDHTSMVALNKHTGEPVWETTSVGGKRSYVSPVLMEYNDIRLILGMTTKHLFAVNPRDGAVQWSFPFYILCEDTQEILTNDPLCRNDEIFLTAGYDHPSVMLKLGPGGKSYTVKWISQALDNHHHGVVLLDGYIYGSNWINNNDGNWVCLDWNTGETMYEHHWENKGNIITAGGLLYLYLEKTGSVGLAIPDPDGFRLVSSFSIGEGSGPHWAHPSIYDGLLFIRHGDILMVFNISENDPDP